MVKFSVFNKVEKLYFTRSLIINSLAIIFIFPVIINSLFGKKIFNSDIEFAMTACLLIFVGIILRIIGYFRYEKLKGYIYGTVELFDDKIIVKGNEYEIGKIKKIEIYGDDYKGKWKLKTRSDYSNALSNGVDNVIRIVMENENESVGVYFLQNEKLEIKKAEKQLVSYYKAGKIHWLKLIEILNITDYDDIQRFKKAIY